MNRKAKHWFHTVIDIFFFGANCVNATVGILEGRYLLANISVALGIALFICAILNIFCLTHCDD